MFSSRKADLGHARRVANVERAHADELAQALTRLVEAVSQMPATVTIYHTAQIQATLEATGQVVAEYPGWKDPELVAALQSALDLVTDHSIRRATGVQ